MYNSMGLPTEPGRPLEDGELIRLLAAWDLGFVSDTLDFGDSLAQKHFCLVQEISFFTQRRLVGRKKILPPTA